MTAKHVRSEAAVYEEGAAAAWARFVPSDLGAGAWFGFERSVLPEIPIRTHEPSRHVNDDRFPLLWGDWLGAHLRVFVVLRSVLYIGLRQLDAPRAGKIWWETGDTSEFGRSQQILKEQLNEKAAEFAEKRPVFNLLCK